MFSREFPEAEISLSPCNLGFVQVTSSFEDLVHRQPAPVLCSSVLRLGVIRLDPFPQKL